MKQAILVLYFISALIQPASAQFRKEIFCVGPMVGGSSTWLMNKNVNDLPEGEQELELTFGSNFGATITTYFSQNVGIGLDVLYSTHNQKYNGVVDPVSKIPYMSKTHLSMLNLPLYLRLSTNYGAYFEIGSVFGFITSAKYTVETTNEKNFPDFAGTKDIKSSTAMFSIAPMLGLGIDIDLNDRLILSPGLRFSYGVKDMKGVDGKGVNVSDYPDYKKTHTMSGGLLIAIVYRIEN